jgi:hypothetical protein
VAWHAAAAAAGPLLLLLACDTGPEQQQHTASYIVHALHAKDTVKYSA